MNLSSNADCNTTPKTRLYQSPKCVLYCRIMHIPKKPVLLQLRGGGKGEEVLFKLSVTPQSADDLSFWVRGVRPPVWLRWARPKCSTVRVCNHLSLPSSRTHTTSYTAEIGLGRKGNFTPQGGPQAFLFFLIPDPRTSIARIFSLIRIEEG